MDRRDFLTIAGSGVALSSLGPTATGAADQAARQSSSLPPMKMHLGTQQGPATPPMLQYLKRCGVTAICASPPDPGTRGYWTAEELEKTHDLCQQHGVALEMIPLPLLHSTHIDHTRRPSILLARDPQRDRDIEDIQKTIAACAKAGVPAFKYNLTFLGVLRTASTPGRGGSSYSTWKLANARQEPPLTTAGRITADIYWERIDYFLQRIVPVCNEYKIRAACHPNDPGVPPQGFQGVDCVLGTPEGLKRFVGMRESPYHGLNFCLGTVAEMLQDPAREAVPLVRWFGSRQKIFNVHFRNIRGHRDDFQEVYPDEGDVDMVQVALALREVDYPYMLMPDHVPRHPEDPGGMQAFAYAYGYIKGVLQAVGKGGGTRGEG